MEQIRDAGKPYRHELKYIITEGEHAVMAHRLRMALPQDVNAAKNGGEYFIRSLYFDDPYETAVSDKIDGVDSRDKFRIRIYNLSDATIKLERKHKEGAYVKKDSLSLTRAECEAIVRGDIRVLYDRGDPLSRAFYGIFRTRCLKPRVLVDYTREPYVFPADDVRVTFDKNVRTALRATDLFNPNLPTYPVWDLVNCMILEVKFGESLPHYVQMLLQANAALRTAASKYVYCRQYEF